MYAIVETGGKQYRVKPGDTIAVERLSGEPGEMLDLGRVLLVGGQRRQSRALGPQQSRAPWCAPKWSSTGAAKRSSSSATSRRCVTAQDRPSPVADARAHHRHLLDGASARAPAAGPSRATTPEAAAPVAARPPKPTAALMAEVEPTPIAESREPDRCQPDDERPDVEAAPSRADRHEPGGAGDTSTWHIRKGSGARATVATAGATARRQTRRRLRRARRPILMRQRGTVVKPVATSE